MPDVYESCPVLTGPTLTLRLVSMDDAEDLLAVYGDKDNNSYFNSDNCTGDFLMTRMDDMRACLRFWLQSYEWKQFVRWSIVEDGYTIGTVECFYRGPSDDLGDSSLLRFDLRGDRHTLAVNRELLSMLLPRLKEFFGGSIAAIKAPPIAGERIAALQEAGFTRTDHPLVGHDGAEYFDYWIRPI